MVIPTLSGIQLLESLWNCLSARPQSSAAVNWLWYRGFTSPAIRLRDNRDQRPIFSLSVKLKNGFTSNIHKTMPNFYSWPPSSLPKTRPWAKLTKWQLILILSGEVTKRKLLYKSQKEGGLGAIDLGLKLKATFCKKYPCWGESRCHLDQWSSELDWKERMCKTANSILEINSDFTNSIESWDINWCETTNKQI